MTKFSGKASAIMRVIPSPMSPTVRKALEQLVAAYCSGAKFRKTSGDPTEKAWERATGNGRFLARMDVGRSPQLNSVDEAVQWFSDNWPEDAKWPRLIERPPQRQREAAE